MIGVWRISCEIALIWMSLNFTDDQSTLVQVMAWCRQATSHYLNQCWPRSLPPYGVTRPPWVDEWIAHIQWKHFTSPLKISGLHTDMHDKVFLCISASSPGLVYMRFASWHTRCLFISWITAKRLGQTGHLNEMRAWCRCLCFASPPEVDLNSQSSHCSVAMLGLRVTRLVMGRNWILFHSGSNQWFQQLLQWKFALRE